MMTLCVFVSFQYPLAFALSFSRWMCSHPWIYRLQASMNLSELTVSGELITKGTRVLVSVFMSLILVVNYQQILHDITGNTDY